jgi:ERF superfamily
MMSQTPVPQNHGSDYLALIERAMRDPDFNPDKFQQLLDMKDAYEMREAEKAFNRALVEAQGAMTTINANASNSQTRSKYATYSALDEAVRPIYTAHGLAPSFNTEPINEPDKMRVLGILGHVGGFARRYQLDMPIDTKGARGGDVMTRTHATGSALTYAKRYLLIAMFNLSIGDDDDGNAAGRPYKPQGPRPAVQQRPGSMDERIDGQTGEVIEHRVPFKIEMTEGSSWAQFIEPFQQCILGSKTIDEWDAWMLLNQDILLKLKETKPQLFRLFEKNIEAKHEELTK